MSDDFVMRECYVITVSPVLKLVPRPLVPGQFTATVCTHQERVGVTGNGREIWLTPCLISDHEGTVMDQVMGPVTVWSSREWDAALRRGGYQRVASWECPMLWMTTTVIRAAKPAHTGVCASVSSIVDERHHV